MNRSISTGCSLVSLVVEPKLLPRYSVVNFQPPPPKSLGSLHFYVQTTPIPPRCYFSGEFDTIADNWYCANWDSFFKTLVDHEVTVELKNDIQIKGTLKSVDQYLNIKLDDIQVVEELKYPHLVSLDSLNALRQSRTRLWGWSGRFIWSYANLAGHVVLCQECVHQGKCGQICSSARKCG